MRGRNENNKHIYVSYDVTNLRQNRKQPEATHVLQFFKSGTDLCPMPAFVTRIWLVGIKELYIDV